MAIQKFKHGQEITSSKLNEIVSFLNNLESVLNTSSSWNSSVDDKINNFRNELTSLSNQVNNLLQTSESFDALLQGYLDLKVLYEQLVEENVQTILENIFDPNNITVDPNGIFVIGGVSTGVQLTTLVGPTGPKGDAGLNGTNGLNGRTIHTGSTVDNNIGAQGDLFFDTSNFDVYVKGVSTFNLIGNIKGSTGATGPQGDGFGLQFRYLSEPTSTPTLSPTDATKFLEFKYFLSSESTSEINQKPWIRIRTRGDAFYPILVNTEDNDVTLNWSTTPPESNLFGPFSVKGPKGDKGDTGVAPTISIGTVETTDSGQNAEVTLTGDGTNRVVNFKLPRGEKGEQGIQGVKGDTGSTPIISNAFAESVSPESNPQAIIEALGNNTYNISFSIPKGLQGEKGEKGDKGDTGEDGTSVTIKGSYSAHTSLPSTGQVNGDGYLIDGDLWVYTGAANSGTPPAVGSVYNGFLNVGSIQGPAGPSGPAGDDGDDGREVQLQKTATHIQWRYVETPAASWNNLVALEDITGPAGTDGTDGTNGTNGTSITVKGNLAAHTNLPSSGAAVGDSYFIDANIWTYTGAVNTGTPPAVNSVYNGFINSGSLRGLQGLAGTLSIPTVNTGAAGTNVILTEESGSTSTNRIYALTVPRGNTGAPGTNGTRGSRIFNVAEESLLPTTTTFNTIALLIDDVFIVSENGKIFRVSQLTPSFVLESVYQIPIENQLIYRPKTIENITKGDLVQFVGVQGGHKLVARASQSQRTVGSYTVLSCNDKPELVMGIAAATVSTNSFVDVYDFGQITNIGGYIESFAEGSILWFDAAGTTLGGLTATEPTGNTHVRLLVAAYVGGSQKILQVRLSQAHKVADIKGLQTALDAKQDASTALTTSTTFGGDVSGAYNAIVVADDSHNHIISNVDGLQTALDGKAASSHTHGNITNAGAIGSNSGLMVVTGSSGVLSAAEVSDEVEWELVYSAYNTGGTTIDPLNGQSPLTLSFYEYKVVFVGLTTSEDNDGVTIQINGLTGSNYNWVYHRTQTTAVDTATITANSDSASATSIDTGTFLNSITATGAYANTFARVEFVITPYSTDSGGYYAMVVMGNASSTFSSPGATSGNAVTTFSGAVNGNTASNINSILITHNLTAGSVDRASARVYRRKKGF